MAAVGQTLLIWNTKFRRFMQTDFYFLLSCCFQINYDWNSNFRLVTGRSDVLYISNVFGVWGSGQWPGWDMRHMMYNICHVGSGKGVWLPELPPICHIRDKWWQDIIVMSSYLVICFLCSPIATRINLAENKGCYLKSL